MLMIVFGAGASFDSVPRRDWDTNQQNSLLQPPLATDLFSKRAPFDQSLEAYPACVPLVSELRGAVARQDPIEKVIQEFVALAERGNDVIARQLMALRFYLRKIIKECCDEWLRLAARATNYATLFNIIERLRRSTEEEVLLVTFNYDTMLEDALSLTLGLSFSGIEDYVLGTRPYCLIKPHGSVNWQRLVRQHISTSVHTLIDDAPHVEPTDFITMEGAESDGRSGIPALAVPTRTKSSV